MIQSLMGTNVYAVKGRVLVTGTISSMRSKGR